jgi:hypothetical protein
MPSLRKGSKNALDYRCPAVDSVAAGDGQFLYLGWTDPHIAGGSCDRGARAHHPGAESGLTEGSERFSDSREAASLSRKSVREGQGL